MGIANGQSTSALILSGGVGFKDSEFIIQLTISHCGRILSSYQSSASQSEPLISKKIQRGHIQQIQHSGGFIVTSAVLFPSGETEVGTHWAKHIDSPLVIAVYPSGPPYV